MKNLRTTQTTALATALLSLGVPAYAKASAEVVSAAPQQQIDLDEVRRTVDQLVSDLKTDAELAQQFEQNPLLVLSTRGVPVALQGDILNEMDSGAKLNGSRDGSTNMGCWATCFWTCT